jgi:NTP pyrophosphatase (non-canonical NTP hydrolase)
MNALYPTPSQIARRERHDKLMDDLARAKRRADHDDDEFWDEGKPTEVYLQTFAEVAWETCEWINGGTYREAVAHIIGARLGNILIDRDTLDAAFPGQVDAKEERLSEEFTARGEYA